MLNKGHAVAFAALLASACALLAGAERRGTAKGTGASPIMRADGGLTIVSQASGAGLVVSRQGAAADLLETTVPVPAGVFVRGPVAKRAPDGTIGVVWAESFRAENTLRYARLAGGIPIPSLALALPDAPLSAPDLDYDAAGGAWIAWSVPERGRATVRAAEVATGRTWVVNGLSTASALQPRILATPSQGVWVIWTGRDAGRDEIFAAVLKAGAWSEPLRLSRGADVPHLSPAAARDADGFPWAVWSEYDGRAYAIFASGWDGTAWSEPERLSVGAGSDAAPAAAAAADGSSIAVWSRAGANASAIVARYRRGAAWSSEIVLSEAGPASIRAPRISTSGETVGLAWEEAGATRTFVLSLAELAAKAASPARPLTPPPVLNGARDESQYTCFGDSITYANGDQGYEPRLQPMLVQRWGPTTLWNEGVGGETTVEGLARIDTALAAHASRFLVLLEGTNDIIFGDISMDTTAYDLTEMVRRAMDVGLLPVISTILPRKDAYWSIPVFQGRIFDLNARIRALAAARKVPLVDQFNVFYYYPAASGGWQSLLLDDGVHPNPKGFDVMAAAWYEGIVALPFAPVRLRLSREADKVLFGERLTEVLRWQVNPKCAPDQIAGFRIYRKERAQAIAAFELRAVFPFLAAATGYRFRDTSIASDKAYAYTVTALRKDGVEGPASEIVIDVP